MKRRENGKPIYWGFAKEFCGLERLALAKEVEGRSPMLEDKEREVFSVNITWPQGQRDKFEMWKEGGARSTDHVLQEIYDNTRRRVRTLSSGKP